MTNPRPTFKIDVSFSLAYGGKLANLQFADWFAEEICFHWCDLTVNSRINNLSLLFLLVRFDGQLPY